VLVVASLALAQMGGLLAAARGAGCRPVGRVEVVRHEIFEGRDGAAPAWPYRMANRLHARTREDVIRRELLFAAGECPDGESVAQTERNLRGTGFLRDARVETVPVESADPNAVDVRVSTYDRWTTVPHLRLAKVGNRTVWTVGVAERNLFGRGQQVELQRRSDIDRDQTLLSFRDPRVAGSRVDASVSLADRSDGRRGELMVGRPFFALDARWSFRARAEAFEQLDPLYQDGERVADLPHQGRALDFEGARAVSRTAVGALRLHGAYRYRRDQVAGDLRRFGIAEAGLSFVEHRFLRLTHVNRFERAEDFNLGRHLSAAAGVSLPELGGADGTVLFLGARGRQGLALGRERFLLADAGWGGRRQAGRWENAIADLRVAGAVRLFPRSVLLSQAVYRHGSNLDPETQMTIGAQNGLRGYAVNQWVGTRSLLVASEARLFVADEVMQLFSFALAAFADAGYAWPRGTPVALRDLRADAGLGLMVGRNRLAGRPLRIDLAYAFNPPAGRSRWQVSMGVQLSFVD
jgi:hypothetical protein